MKRRNLLGAVAASPFLAGCLGFSDSYTLGTIVLVDFNSDRGATIDLEVTLDEETVYDERIHLSEKDGSWTAIDDFPEDSGTYQITASLPDFDVDRLSVDPGENRDHDCMYVRIMITDATESDAIHGIDPSDEVTYGYTVTSCEEEERRG